LNRILWKVCRGEERKGKRKRSGGLNNSSSDGAADGWAVGFGGVKCTA
jgi:hypothetical protein